MKGDTSYTKNTPEYVGGEHAPNQRGEGESEVGAKGVNGEQGRGGGGNEVGAKDVNRKHELREQVGRGEKKRKKKKTANTYVRISGAGSKRCVTFSGAVLRNHEQ